MVLTQSMGFRSGDISYTCLLSHRPAVAVVFGFVFCVVYCVSCIPFAFIILLRLPLYELTNVCLVVLQSLFSGRVKLFRICCETTSSTKAFSAVVHCSRAAHELRMCG